MKAVWIYFWSEASHLICLSKKWILIKTDPNNSKFPCTELNWKINNCLSVCGRHDKRKKVVAMVDVLLRVTERKKEKEREWQGDKCIILFFQVYVRPILAQHWWQNYSSRLYTPRSFCVLSLNKPLYCSKRQSQLCCLLSQLCSEAILAEKSWIMTTFFPSYYDLI